MRSSKRRKRSGTQSPGGCKTSPTSLPQRLRAKVKSAEINRVRPYLFPLHLRDFDIRLARRFGDAILRAARQHQALRRFEIDPMTDADKQRAGVGARAQ